MMQHKYSDLELPYTMFIINLFIVIPKTVTP